MSYSKHKLAAASLYQSFITICFHKDTGAFFLCPRLATIAGYLEGWKEKILTLANNIDTVQVIAKKFVSVDSVYPQEKLTLFH